MPRSIEVEVEVHIGRPAEEVWAFIADGERLPDWLEEFHAVVKQSEGPIGDGTIYRYTLEPGHRSSTIQYVEWEPGTAIGLGWPAA